MLKKIIRTVFIAALFIFGSFGQYHNANAQVILGGGHGTGYSSAATTNPATSLSITSMTLNGAATVATGDYAWQTEFDYGTTTGYGTSITNSVYYGSFSSHVFSTNITGLSCGTIYHYRVLVEFGYTSSVGSDATSTTTACASSATVASVISTATSSAVLDTSTVYIGSDTANATVTGFRYEPSGGSWNYAAKDWSTYYPGSSYTISGTITGLSPSTTYTYQPFIETTVSGSTYAYYYGPSGTFTTTTPAAPTVSTTSKTVSGTSVTMTGNISATGGASVSEAGFQYGTTTTYGATSTHVGSFTVPGSYVQNISGLMCETTYNFRAYAYNGSYAYGSNMTFTTGPCTGSNGNLSGYIWSSNIGWISLNCNQGSSSGTSVCGSSAYSVNVVPNSATQTGVFSGYAWSSNIGWVSFNPSDVSSCGVGTTGAPNPGAQATIDLSSGASTSGQVSGWAKALAGDPTTGWDGCISLRGSGYGVTYVATSTTNNLAGSASAPSYAWGSNVVGWISFANASITFPTPTISLTVSSPTLTSAGGPVTLRWTTSNLSTTSCTATSSDGLWTGSVASGGGSALITIPANTSTSSVVHTYTLSGCTNILGGAVAATSVTVTLSPNTAASVVFYANNVATSSAAPLTIASGDSVTLTWQLQNISQDSCIGTSGGTGSPFTGWSSTGKAPLSANSQPSVGTTPVTYSEVIPGGVITSNRTYTLTCTGATAQTVYINTTATTGTPSVNLTIDGGTSRTFGTSYPGPVTLAWNVSNVDSTSCTESGDYWTGSVPATDGSVAVSVPSDITSTAQNHTYTLTCTGLNGLPVSDTVTATVPGSTAALSFLGNGESSPTITPGSSVTLTWQVQNVAANACHGTSSGTGSPFTGWNSTTKLPSVAIGSTATSVTEIVGADGSITSNRTYTMTCGSLPAQTVSINVANSNGSATLVLNGDANTRSIDMPSSGGSINLSWVTSNLDPIDCNAVSSDGTTSWSGTKSYNGGSVGAFTVASNSSTTAPVVHTYSLQDCYSGGVLVPPSVVYVNVLPSGAPFLSLVASNGTASSSDLTVSPSDSVSLIWKIQNIVANSCKGANDNSYNGWTNTGASESSASAGTYSASLGTISTSRAYTMTCTGTNGAVVFDTATINVNGSGVGTWNGPHEDTSIAVNGDYPIYTMSSAGGSATLVWTTTLAASTNCTASSSAGDWSGTASYLGGSQSLSIGSNSSTSVAVARTYTLSGCMGAYSGQILPTKTVTVTVAPASTPLLISFTANGVSSETPITITAGSLLTLGWQVQNVSANSCVGTSGGASSPFIGWNSTTKLPNTSITTAQTFYDYLGSDGSIGDSRTYTINCGTAGTKTVTVNVIPAPPSLCVGLSCSAVITPPSINAIHRPPWMEI